MKKRLEAVYRRLYGYFGPQHWWPAETPFEVMIGAILTQNTSWSNVERAIINLKRNNLLSPLKLRKIPARKLAFCIKPSGYYNIKSQRLKEFLRFFFGRYRASLKAMAAQETARLRSDLLSVKGIGEETADSMLLYALRRPVFVIDAYTKRFLSRHKFVKEGATYGEAQNLFMRNLKPSVVLFNEYHALFVRLGKEFCLKRRPKCEGCPLKEV